MKLHKRATISIQELCAELGASARKKLRDAGEQKSL
jgi:hypothetical protein